MHGIGIGDFAGCHKVRNIQVRIAALRLANAHGFVGKLYVQAVRSAVE
jgi:hypothetical protein